MINYSEVNSAVRANVAAVYAWENNASVHWNSFLNQTEPIDETPEITTWDLTALVPGITGDFAVIRPNKEFYISDSEYHINGESEGHAPIRGSSAVVIGGASMRLAAPRDFGVVLPNTVHALALDLDSIHAVFSVPSYKPENTVVVNQGQELEPNIVVDWESLAAIATLL